MNPQVTELLEALAKKLGTTIEYLWPLLVRHTYITAVTALIGCLLGSVVCIYGSYKCFKLVVKHTGTHNDWDILCLPGSILALGAAILLACALCAIPDMIVPEAAAVKSLLHR